MDVLSFAAALFSRRVATTDAIALDRTSTSPKLRVRCPLICPLICPLSSTNRWRHARLCSQELELLFLALLRDPRAEGATPDPAGGPGGDANSGLASALRATKLPSSV